MSVPDALRTALADHYTLDRELGRGGMAVVYLAQDLRHDRPVALKVLLPELAATLGPERFQREIKLAARLQHPHILTVHDSGEAAGRLWFTMPFVEGESLRDRLRRERQLPVDDALRITVEAARALDYAHQHGVVHRDIKPENILLTRDGSTLVADFGIARALGGDEGDGLTRTGFSVGTPAYMSPEQAAGDRSLGPRTDLYSLASVLYEMLAGEPPFTGPTVTLESGACCSPRSRRWKATGVGPPCMPTRP
jgi:serine/threonine-protein kinase